MAPTTPGFTRHSCRVRPFAAALAVACGLVLAAPGAAWADKLADGAKQCTHFLPEFEQTYGIPSYLLAAIASTESGRWNDGLRIALPWPWTINVNGKGYYFDTKAEAIAAARRFRAQGVKSMDVGCMQVNLMHHPNAFRSLEDAFEPKNNVGYAASFLRSLFLEAGNWRSAAAAYHSKTPVFGEEYVVRVLGQWRTIVDRVREAKRQTGVPATAVASLTTAPLENRYHSSFAGLSPASKTAAKTAVASANMPTSMKVIQVKPASKRNDVLVIRPSVEPSMPETMPVAAAAPAMMPAAAIENVSAPSASGPRFIFSN